MVRGLEVSYWPLSMILSTTSGSGGAKRSPAVLRVAKSMNSCHIGPAAEIPAPAAVMGVLLLFPTQTPATTDAVYPSTQASRFCCVVPVLAATCLPLKASELLIPKTAARALLSESISDKIRV